MADGEDHVEPIQLDSESGSEAETLENTSGNLQPLKGATSVVWKFFDFDASKDGRILVVNKRKWRAVTCIRCKKKLKCTGGTSKWHCDANF